MDDVTEPPRLCAHCSTPLIGRFCYTCGQDSLESARTLHEFAASVVRHFFMRDSRFWRSVRALVTRPGLLSRAYAEHRGAAFVPPFRIYLTASLIFLASLGITGLSLVQLDVRPGPGADDPLTFRIAGARRTLAGWSVGFIVPPSAPIRVIPVVGPALRFRVPLMTRIANGLASVSRAPWLLTDIAAKWAPRVTFAMVPLAALVFWALGGTVRRLYVDNLAFALHLQAFMALMGVVAAIATWIGVPLLEDWLPLLAALIYTVQAHAVFRGNRLWKSIVLAPLGLAVHLLLLAVGASAAILWSVSDLPRFL